MIFVLILLFVIILLLIYNLTGIGHRENGDYSLIESSNYLEGGESFEHVEGHSKAVLFIHGFPGSPRMYYLVKKLAIRDGFDVFCPALPGFGTNHNDFIKSNFSMWFRFLDDYYASIRGNYDRFYIVGNSMGGALTLKLAEKYSGTVNNPTAIATVAAPVYIKRFLSKFLRTISLFTSYIPSKKASKPKSEDQDGETEWVGYRGLFPKQSYSLLQGFKGIKKDLSKITVPCYFCHAKEDKTVPFENLKYISSRVSSENILIRILSMKGWRHSNHSLFIYKSYYESVWSDIEYFFRLL